MTFKKWDEGYLFDATALRMKADWKAEREHLWGQINTYIDREIEQEKEREKLIGALEQLIVWSEAFEALPPDDMKDIFPFSQYITAGDCRQLKIALKYARAILEEKEKRE